MAKYTMTGFADEISENFDEQLEYLAVLGVKYMEIRGVDGTNISKLTDEELQVVKEKLDKAGVKISSVGSPIGKYDITAEFSEHFDVFKKICATAKLLNTKYIRMFSFHLPEGADKADYKDEVIEKLKAFIDYAKEQDLVLLHENEKGIFGDTFPACEYIMRNLYCDNFKAVFDFANFVQCDQDTMEAYKALKPYIEYIHIKDAIGMDIVPAGQGQGQIKDILTDVFANGYEGFLSMEPHLAEFAGLKELEDTEDEIVKEMTDRKKAWKLALDSLKAILAEIA